MSRLLAISDLHLSHSINRQAFESFPDLGTDWLIVAGDIANGCQDIDRYFKVLSERCGQVIWVPGNHDLWTRPGSDSELRGVSLYNKHVDLARSHRILTPEDPYQIFPHPNGDLLVAPLFLHYDYSFRPQEIPKEDALNWARDARTLCNDEYCLHPDPYSSQGAWCASLVEKTQSRLEAAPTGIPKVLVNHYPLEQELAVLPRIPRFTPWCGTQLTKGWHNRFNACAVIYGHLHIRGIYWLDGVPFQEVSLGYPQQWRQEIGIEGYLREVEIAPFEGGRGTGRRNAPAQ